MANSSPAHEQSPASDAGVIDAIAAFMDQCSFEATRPSPAELQALGGLIPKGSPLFLTALPNRAPAELERAAMLAREAGLTPVPHLSARHFTTFDALDAHLANLRASSGADQIMLVGGDMAKPVGEVQDALAVIESGLLEKHAIARVHLPGFPDGHPHVDADQLETSLVTKLAALQQRGVESEIVSQFCFEAAPIIKWLDALRGRGVHVPVRIGLAGPTTLLKWLGYARRCGVKASAEALASRSGLVKQAFRAMAPDPLIRTLAQAAATGRIDAVRPHLFAFGGVEDTVKWALKPMRGAIALNKDGGFDAR